MPVDVIVSVQHNTDVSAARRAALAIAELTGLQKGEMGAVGIVVTEAATNLIKHGGGGEIVLRELRGRAEPVLEVIALDRGKGMSSVARCREDGFSTAGSPGTGLGAIARLSSFHEVYSLPGCGTVLVAHIGPPAPTREWFDIGAISIPYPGEVVCGDAWVSRTSAGRCRLVVADGLGHGLYASEASARAIDAVSDDRLMEPPALLEEVHSRLRSTRGAAVAVADLDYSSGTVTFAGVGNIAGSIVSGPDRRQMVSMNGTAGHEMRRVQQYKYPLAEDSLVVIHSDGLSTHWSLDKYPGLARNSSSVIAAVLLRDCRRLRDDATVIVFRAFGSRR